MAWEGAKTMSDEERDIDIESDVSRARKWTLKAVNEAFGRETSLVSALYMYL